ncbi:MAG: LysR substrate-binding domain-containing protein [Acidobacteriota bacterium]|nr:LysR substrate-binding domain-containing protein [Acidobacteriota bacterium]
MLENFRLRVFRAVADHLSFRKAGEQLYLTQPAITLQIKTLEDEIGTKLFDRRATGVTLTEAGKSLLNHAVQLARLAEEAENGLAQLRGEASGELVLGASTTIAQYVLPPRLAAFARRFPAIHLRVASENTEHIVEGVASGRFGLGLIEGPPLSREIRIETWFEDELVIVVPRSHEWASLGSIPAASLMGVPLIMRERGSGSRHVVEEGLQRAGLRLGQLTIVMELDSSEAILSCIEAGLGVGFASVWAFDRRSLDLTLAKIHLDRHSLTRNFSFAMPSTPNLSAPAAAMKRFLDDRVTNSDCT